MMANRDGPEPADHANVALHPPLFYLAALALAFAFKHVYSFPVFTGNIPRFPAIVLAVVGLGIVATGRQVMQKHRTNLNPTKPTTTIIQTGPWRYSRNPLYIALTMAYTGFALLMNT